MKNSRLELRAISEFNFMLRYKAAPAASDNQSDLDASKKVKKQRCQERRGEWEMGDRG